ncbi:23S rRNA (guanosine(2251)-2'-O)-methyltransferase RlmB [Chryseolinea sp. T2]|uniref:23S rRNA (guanosine(2251)-2'-O)-methyltransferase RlmB n=1 Tax=Chryseolinea sp. T2 TaxID=3129255 RepID=UPI003077E692
MAGPGMIYGTRAVIEAILAGKDIDKVMVQTGLSNELVRELFNVARERNISIQSVPAERLKRISSKNHQGVICMLSPVSFASVENLIAQAYEEGREPFFIMLDRVTDVRNFGAVVRTAECAGVDGIIIPDKGSAPITADAMKTSAGALNYVPVCREKDLKKTIRLLQESGIRIVACTEKTDKDLYQFSLIGPVALVVGSEEDGISDAILREADDLAKIPLKGKIGSLNVSVAAAVAMYEIVRQRGIKN